MPPPTRQEPTAAVIKAYDLVLWLVPKVEGFSRSHRFTIGDRLVSAGLDLLLSLVQASYATDKAGLLQAASLHSNVVRYLLRLAKDLRLMSIDAYGFATERVEEIGRMVGGWQKSLGKRP